MKRSRCSTRPWTLEWKHGTHLSETIICEARNGQKVWPVWLKKAIRKVYLVPCKASTSLEAILIHGIRSRSPTLDHKPWKETYGTRSAAIFWVFPVLLVIQEIKRLRCKLIISRTPQFYDFVARMDNQRCCQGDIDWRNSPSKCTIVYINDVQYMFSDAFVRSRHGY